MIVEPASPELAGAMSRLGAWAPRQVGQIALDVSIVLSTLESLLKANAEQAAVIERLSRPSARAGDVAAFIRDPDELGQVKP